MQSEQSKFDAIGTLYDGYSFRSRNEAKWAVFFKHMGLQYRYEPTDMFDGRSRILPDFYLQDLDVYLEVKHNGFSEDDRNGFLNKYSIVTAQTGTPCVIAYGDPREATTDRHWNNSVLLFMSVPADLPPYADERTLCYSRVWFSSDGEGISLSTDMDADRHTIVACADGKWTRRKYIWTPNVYGRDVEKVALYARQWQFEYVGHPEHDSSEADERIEDVWRSKNAPKASCASVCEPAPYSWTKPKPSWA